MKYGHYLKECKFEKIDIYRILEMYNVTSPAIQHSVKKLLVAGGRGAKDAKKDVEEAIDSLMRWLEMRREESGENMQGNNLSVNICDSLNLADSFLKDIRASELAYAENQHKTLWTEADEERMRVVVHNGNDGEVYKQDGGWIQNKAGVQPVPNKCKVDVRFPVGVVEDVFAGSLYWRPCDGDASIVAYRIRNEIYNDDEEAQV